MLNFYLILKSKSFNVPNIYTVGIGKDGNDSNLEGKILSIGSKNMPNIDKSQCSSDKCSKSFKGATDVYAQFLKKNPRSLKEQSKLKVMLFNRPVDFLYNKNYTFKGVNVSRYELDESEISMKSEKNKCLCDGEFNFCGLIFY